MSLTPDGTLRGSAGVGSESGTTGTANGGIERASGEADGAVCAR